MPTGSLSGYLVLDVDPPLGKESLAAFEAKYGSLPKTMEARTPRGGRHIYFRYIPIPGIKNSAGKLAPNLDIKTEGGYIILPPSHGYSWTCGNEIADIPKWLIEELLNMYSKKENIPKVDSPCTVTNGTPYGIKCLENICAEMAQTPEGSRNDKLYKSAFRIGTWIAGGELSDLAVDDLKDAALVSGLPIEEVEKTILSGVTGGLKCPATAPPRKYKRQKKEENNPKNSETLIGIVFDKPAEDVLALKFADLYGADWRYCHDTGKWYFYNGQLWRIDKTRRILNKLREFCREENTDDKPIIGKSSTIKGVEKLLSAIEPIATTSDTFDTNDILVGCPNGVIELVTGLFREGSREDFITLAVGIDPAKDEDCPIWKKFLFESTKGDEKYCLYLARVAGYCLSGLTTEHALFVLIGPGGNGKSVFENILRKMMSDYATTASFELFAVTRNEQHPTGLAALMGKRLVTASEVDAGQTFAEARIKAITGGDTISARYMRQDFFTYQPRFKAIIAANNRPQLRNVDDAIRRRVKMLPFENKPVNPDKELESKLMAELPGILRWAINGFLAWQREGLNPPASVEKCTKDYFESEDVFGSWLKECCNVKYECKDNCDSCQDNKIDENAPTCKTCEHNENCRCIPAHCSKCSLLIVYQCKANASELYTSWVKWREARGEKPGTTKMFSEYLIKQGFHRVHQKKGKFYFGLCLVTGDGR
jgi:P4 family phage/plasmid primase-like protien